MTPCASIDLFEATGLLPDHITVTGGVLSRVYTFSRMARGRHQRNRSIDEMGALDAPDRIPAGSTRWSMTGPRQSMTRREGGL